MRSCTAPSWGGLFRDIDLGIFIQGVKKRNFWEYADRISQKIQKEMVTPFPVDVRVINYAPVSFAFQVIRGRLLFVRDENAMAGFMVRVARVYLDMAPLRHKYILEAMA